ncbi:MAG: NFACT family protein [Candidatus Anstonellaceae archaeon]
MQQMSSADLHFVLAELSFLQGKHIGKIRKTQDGIFLFKIGSQELLFEPPVRLHLTMQAFQAQPSPDGFVAFLRKRLEGKKVDRIWQHESDRIVLLKSEEQMLIFELFRKGNLILADSNNCILACLRNDDAGGRKIAKGEKYSFPKPTGFKMNLPLVPSFGVKLDASGKPSSYSFEAQEGDLKFQTFSEALDFYYANQPRETADEREAQKAYKKLVERLEHQKKALEEIELKRQEARKCAEAIYSNFEAVSQVLQEANELKAKGLEIEKINDVLAAKKAKFVSAFELEIELPES